MNIYEKINEAREMELDKMAFNDDRLNYQQQSNEDEAQNG